SVLFLPVFCHRYPAFENERRKVVTNSTPTLRPAACHGNAAWPLYPRGPAANRVENPFRMWYNECRTAFPPLLIFERKRFHVLHYEDYRPLCGNRPHVRSAPCKLSDLVR